MTNAFTLDAIREIADAKYGSTDITIGDTVCKLRNVLRLPKDQRKALMDLQKSIEAESEDEENEADQTEFLGRAIRLVCENEHQANVLLGAVGDDLGVLATIFEKYNGEQETGEASASAN